MRIAAGTIPRGLRRATAATTIPVKPTLVARDLGSRARVTPLTSMAPARPARPPDTASTATIFRPTFIPAYPAVRGELPITRSSYPQRVPFTSHHTSRAMTTAMMIPMWRRPQICGRSAVAGIKRPWKIVVPDSLQKLALPKIR